MTRRYRRPSTACRLAASAEEPTVNLTPLIDVVFVVLIMFIVLAPILELDHVALAPSDNQTEKQAIHVQDEHPVSIHVHADNSIWVNKSLVTLDVLRSLLKTAREQHPQAIPLIFHDRRAQFGTYQHVKNAVESAGFPEMNVVLEPA